MQIEQSSILLILSLLFLKHFIVDFPLQIPYMYLNKGKYGHPGGIFHAGYHGLGTYLVLLFFIDSKTAFIFGMVDFFIHYNIDYMKVKINNKYNLKPDNSEKFWWLLGLDQLLHAMTYIVIVEEIIS